MSEGSAFGKVVLTPKLVMPNAAARLVPPIWYQWYVDQRIEEITGIHVEPQEPHTP